MDETALPNPAEVDRALAAVFSRPEFQTPAPSPLHVWFREAAAAVRSFVFDLFSGVSLTDGSLTVLFWIVVALLAIATSVLGVRLARSRWRGGRSRSAPDRSDQIDDQDTCGASIWEERAARAAAEARWRDAALALYRVMLLGFHEQSVLRFDTSKTPGDYRRETRSHPEAHRALVAFLRVFEPVAFGNRHLDAASFDELRQAARVQPNDG